MTLKKIEYEVRETGNGKLVTYHVVGDMGTYHNIPIKNFEGHMDKLRKEGYKIVLADLNEPDFPETD